MNSVANKKITILRELSRVPEKHLDALTSYLETFLEDIQAPPLQNQSLKGIWENSGFDKIDDLEEELQAVRQELQSAILKRKC